MRGHGESLPVLMKRDLILELLKNFLNPKVKGKNNTGFQTGKKNKKYKIFCL